MSNSRRKACAGKVRHDSLLAAQIALKRTLANSRKGDPIVTGLSAYRCRYCGGWHVGRSQKKGIDWAAVERHSKVNRSAVGGVAPAPSPRVLNALEVLERMGKGFDHDRVTTAGIFLKLLGEAGMWVIENPLHTPAGVGGPDHG